MIKIIREPEAVKLCAPARYSSYLEVEEEEEEEEEESQSKAHGFETGSGVSEAELVVVTMDIKVRQFISGGAFLSWQYVGSPSSQQKKMREVQHLGP